MGRVEIIPHVALGPLDQIAPRIYVRSVFIFDVDKSFELGKALCHIANRFQASLLRWPFLTGHIRPATYPRRPNELEIHYCCDQNLADPSQRPDLFAYQSCEGLGGYTYEDLKLRGMPPSAMDKDVLSLSPNHPKPGESCPPVTLKVTRVNSGGLILCFSTHHAIFDGGFIKTFLEFFGRGCERIPGQTFVREHMTRPSMERHEGTNIENVMFPEYNFTTDIDLNSGMSKLVMDNTAAGQAQKAPRAVCALFQIPNSTLQMLHGCALTQLRDQHGPKAFVSMVDTLSALFWVHTTRARLPHLSLADKTSFTTAADARPRLCPSFSPDAWGNVYTQTSASASVGDLILAHGGGSGVNMDVIPSVAAAAWFIRQAVGQVNSPGYIPSRIALAASLADPTMEGVAFRKALQPDHAGLGCSVWVHMGADVDFGIPGTKGVADHVRKTWSANDGSMNIMQRRGVTKGEAPWEVLLALREDDMERICAPVELGRWASSWCA